MSEPIPPQSRAPDTGASCEVGLGALLGDLPVPIVVHELGAGAQVVNSSFTREFLNPSASRSGLDRCLRRHGVGNLRDLKPKAEKPAHKPFKIYEPGYLHIDVKYLPQMADEERRRYLFVAIDRATRWVFVRIYPAKTAANARRFLRDLERAAPMKITKVLTDNGKEFTDRRFGLRRRAATGSHAFDRLCADLGIEHRLAPPMRPQTNGMVERFNGKRRPTALGRAA